VKPVPGTALVGVAYMLMAGLFFSVLDTTAKYVATSVTLVMLLSIRFLMQALVSTLVLLPLHGRALFQISQPRLQLLRGTLLATSTVMAVSGLKLMPIGEFTAIVMVTPMLVTVLAVTVLKQRIAPMQWLFVMGGLAGTLMIIRPGAHSLGWGALLPLGCLLSNSLFQLLTGHLGRHDSAASTHFCSVWFCAALATVALPLGWQVLDSSSLWGLMLLMGVIGAAGHFVLTQAYQHAPTVVLMPFMYGHIGFAVLGGWLVFDHIPDQWAVLGMLVIAASGIASAWVTARPAGQTKEARS
jgi:drug/metabolite transporter (DMT)-like permease